ncbi:MAG: hypothetical protein PVG65_04470 [Candidatus Thorarchaeota archaeon]|jgi:hypothetical protein
MNKKPFCVRAWRKFIENCLSVKVWIIFGYMVLCYKLVLMGKMTGITFAETNAAVIGVVLAVREGIKIAKIKKSKNSEHKNIMT